MNELQIFSYGNSEIRTVIIDGESWWVLKDVCEILGLSNATVVADRLDNDEVTKFDLGGRIGETNIVNESGLYNVIIRSDKPEAKKFKRWVTHEILPTIRKHGAYLTPAKLDEVIKDPDTMIKILTALKDEQEKNNRLLVEVSQKDQIIGELRPKADYTDRILQSKGTVKVTSIAKDYGMSGNEFNKLLNTLKVQYKQGDIWLLYKPYQKKGYTHSKTFDYTDSKGLPQVRMSTQWTQKGRLFCMNC